MAGTLSVQEMSSTRERVRPEEAAARRRRYVVRRRLGKLLLSVTTGVLSLVFVLPFLWMLSTSFKTDPQVYHIPPIWIPNPLRWANYPEGMTYVPFGLYFSNTLRYCLGTVVGVILSSAFCAYGFARLQWKGRNLLFYIVLGTMMIPFQVRMIPLYLIFKKLGWLNTYLPLIIPSFTGSAYFIFLLRQFFMTIPVELSDAARIDGASEVGILFRIILPLAKPALAVIGLFQFMDAWNDYMGPLIYLRDTEKYPIAMGLEQMRSHSVAATESLVWPHLMAASAVVTIPIVILYFLTQRTFVEGITLTGVKG